MSDIWQEHRRFIMSLVGGGLVVLIIHLVISGIYSSDIRRYGHNIRRARATQKRSIPSGVSLRELRAERQQEEKGFHGLVAVVQRVPEAGYSLDRSVQNPDLAYSRQIEKLRANTVESCALRNIAVEQNLGLPDRFPNSRIEKDWYLKGLDIVRQVLLLALAADELFEGGIARVDNIKIERPSRNAKVKGNPLVMRQGVRLSIVGHPRAIDTVMSALPLRQGKDVEDPSGNFLTVLEASINSLDRPPGARRRRGRTFEDPADQNRVRLDLRVAGVWIDKEGSL